MAALPAGLLAVMLVAGWLSTAWLDAEGVNHVLVLALSAFALFQYWWALLSTRVASDDAVRRAELEAALVESERRRDELVQSLDRAVQDARAAKEAQNVAVSVGGAGGSKRVGRVKSGGVSVGSRPVVLATPAKAVSFRPDDVLYVESLNRERLVHLANGEVATTTVALGQIAEQLPEGSFTYCHRSIVVNLARVREVTRSEVILEDGTSLLASRRRYQELSDALVAAGTASSKKG